MTAYFENLVPPEGVRAELLRGDIVMTYGTGVAHNRAVALIQDQIPHNRWHRLQTQDLDIAREASEPVPDLVVAAPESLPTSGRLLPSSVVTTVVEVVSKTSVDRDHGVKRSIYAAGGIPAYLIVDPIMARCVLLTEPAGKGEDADYTVQRRAAFGAPLTVDILGVELDTTGFGTLPNARPHRWFTP